MAVDLIQPLARQHPLMSKKFTMGTNKAAQQRESVAEGLWKALVLLKTTSIRLHTKMGAFQNAVDRHKEARDICQAIGASATLISCECELAIGDTYLRLGMWEEAHNAFTVVHSISLQHHSLPGTAALRAKALAGRADAARKSGAFYEHARDVEELKSLVYESDVPLLPPVRTRIMHSCYMTAARERAIDVEHDNTNKRRRW